MIFCFNPAYELVVWQYTEEELIDYGDLTSDEGPTNYIYFFADLDTKEY